MTGGEIMPGGRQKVTIVGDGIGDLGAGELLHPSGGQLDAQWQPFHQLADPDNLVGALLIHAEVQQRLLGARHEELKSVKGCHGTGGHCPFAAHRLRAGDRQAMHHDKLLGLEVQPLA